MLNYPQRRVIALLACLVVGLGWYSSRCQPPECNATGQTTKSDETHNAHSAFWNWITNDATGFFTFWLVIIGTSQAGLFLWQLRYMRKGIEDARIAAEAAQASAETAKEQVEVAKAQIEVTKIGIFDLERAYLAVGPTEIVVDFSDAGKALARTRGFYLPSDPEELTVHLFVQNTGRTGATIKKIYGLLTDSPPLGESPLYLPLPDQPSITDLAVPAGTASKLDPFEFKSDIAGNQFFWGYIEYIDIFKKTHTSRFCAHLEPAVRGGKGKYQIAGTDRWRECD
jgi:hypothetical protein